MDRRLKWRLLLIVFIFLGSLWSVYPLSQKINLGLDLQGGMHLILKVDTSTLKLFGTGSMRLG